jgi:hypothetical protein
VATPGPSLKDSRNIADWLPLLGSIVQALSGMAEDDWAEDDRAEDDRAEDDRAEDDRVAERRPAAAGDGESNLGATAR